MTTRANVFLKAAGALASNYSGVAFGHYFLAGRLVTREEYFAAKGPRQGKAGKGERAQVKIGGAKPVGTAAKPASAPPSAHADPRHNPDLDDLFGEAPAKPASPPADIRSNGPDIFNPQETTPRPGPSRKRGRGANGKPAATPAAGAAPLAPLKTPWKPNLAERLLSREGAASPYEPRPTPIPLERAQDAPGRANATSGGQSPTGGAKPAKPAAQPPPLPKMGPVRLRAHADQALADLEAASKTGDVGKIGEAYRNAHESLFKYDSFIRQQLHAGRRGAGAKLTRRAMEAHAKEVGGLQHRLIGLSRPYQRQQIAANVRAEHGPGPQRPAGPQTGARPMPSTPPALPHQRTQQAALRTAQELSQAVAGGDRKQIAYAHARAISTLQVHLKEGLRAIDRMAAERYGAGPKAARAAAKAKEAFRTKVQAVSRRLAGLRVKGKAFGGMGLVPLGPLFPPAPEDIWNRTTEAHDMNPDLVAWRAKKLDGDDLAYLLPDPGLSFDGGKMVVHVVASTDTMDRERDVVLAKGGDFADHRKNPIVMLNHRKDLPGIAKAMGPDGAYTVRLANDHEIHSSHHFDPKSRLSVQSFAAIESGALGGVSISFQPVPGTMHKAMGPDKHPCYVYPQWKLLEITHAPLGVNPDAVVRAVEKGFGGESLCAELKDILTPYMPERKPLANGWSPPMSETIEKAAGAGGAMSTTDDSAGGSMAGDGDTSLTTSSEFFHTAHAALENMVGYVTDQLKTIESPSTREAADELLSLLGKALDACQEGHSTHLTDHPDQPPLPDPLDADRDGDDDATMKAFGVKAVEAWAAKVAAMRKELAAEEVRKAHSHAEVLEEFARDASKFDRRSRTIFKAMVRDFRAFKGGVTPARAETAAEVEEREAREFLAALDERLAAQRVNVGG